MKRTSDIKNLVVGKLISVPKISGTTIDVVPYVVLEIKKSGVVLCKLPYTTTNTKNRFNGERSLASGDFVINVSKDAIDAFVQKCKDATKAGYHKTANEMFAAAQSKEQLTEWAKYQKEHEDNISAARNITLHRFSKVTGEPHFYHIDGVEINLAAIDM